MKKNLLSLGAAIILILLLVCLTGCANENLTTNETIETEQLENGCYTIVYDDPKAQDMIDLVHKMEQKHYDKFCNMLNKYHTGWWT